MSEIKQCRRCKENKYLDLFYKNKKMKDGRASYCIVCSKIQSKAYNDSPKGREKLYKLQKERYDKGLRKKYYKKKLEREKKPCGRKKISDQEVERREQERKLLIEKKKENKKILKDLNILLDKNDKNINYVLAMCVRQLKQDEEITEITERIEKKLMDIPFDTEQLITCV